MTVLTVPASFLPSALARLNASGAAPADRREAWPCWRRSFTSARNAESTAELLGLDPAVWSRTIRLLEDAGAVVRAKRRGRRGIAFTPERAIRGGWPALRFSLLVVGALFVWTKAGWTQQTALTGFSDGNDIIARCESADLVPKALCAGYITGVADAIVVNKIDGKKLSCPPLSSTPQQFIDIVLGFLASHPDTRRNPGAWVISVALSEAFPCN